MSINGHENLTVDVANEILQRRNDSHNPKYLTLNVEFSMPNTIEASSGVFNVKLAKTTAGLGVTITGKNSTYNSRDKMLRRRRDVTMLVRVVSKIVDLAGVDNLDYSLVPLISRGNRNAL